jgi:serine/threonine-protein kinase
LELVRGHSWRIELERVGRIPPAQAADLFDQLIAAMEFAHGEHIVHRDLKPENILLAGGPAPRVKVLDFGLAKFRQQDAGYSLSISESGAVVGTRGYMSPEQFNGEQVDERTDIFALGVIAAETITGWRTSGTVHPMRTRELFERHFPVAALSREQTAVRQILARCLEPDPQQRTSSVRELRRELILSLRCCSGWVLEKTQAAADATETTN